MLDFDIDGSYCASDWLAAVFVDTSGDKTHRCPVYVGGASVLIERTSGSTAASMIVATRFGNQLVAVRLSPRFAPHLPALFFRIAYAGAPQPSPYSAATIPRLHAELRFGSPAEAMKLLLLIKRCHAVESASLNDDAYLVWMNIHTGATGEQRVTMDLIDAAEDATELPDAPSFEAGSASPDTSPVRHEELDVVGGRLLSRYASGLIRLIDIPMVDRDMPIPSAITELRVQGWPLVTTLGRAGTPAQAKMVAALEALERYAGLLALPGGDVVTRRLDQMEVPTLDPRAFGLHPDHFHADERFPYRRYVPETPIDWVMAKEALTDERIAVPACFAHYGGTSTFPKVRLTFESSNGCAIGTSASEALLHGVLELVERDAFLMAWYRQRPLHDITHTLCLHDAVRWHQGRIALTTGFNLRILRSTQEHGVPSVVVVALNDLDEAPKMVLAAGSGLTYQTAAIAALGEVTGHIFFLKQMFKKPGVSVLAKALLEDSDAVMAMEDHGIVNAMPERVRFSEALWSRTDILDPEMLRDEEILDSRNVSESLKCILYRLKTHEHHVYSVAHESKKLRSLGLHACKVMIPGFLPMTFGHRHRRVRFARIGDTIAQEHAEALPPHPFM